MAQSFARHVCANCRRRKKRCDKTLPECTQCKDLRVECTYPDPANIDETQQIQNRLTRLETLLLPQAYQVTLSENNNLGSLHQWLPPPPSPPTSLWSEASLNGVQHCLTTLANSIFQSDASKITEEDIYTAYFTYINGWLPILSRNKFYKQLSNDRLMSRRPESVLLLMCMYLLVKDPSSLGPSEDIHNHHKMVRSAYFMLQAEPTGSLELAQSGLMLATYEHASGLVEQAYSTIWTCVQMTHSLCLEDKFQKGIDNDHDKRIEFAEAHALWWSILIRDRYINLEDKMRHQPLASRNPSLDDYEPVNIDAWEKSSYAIPLLERHISDCRSGQLSPDSFGREAQVCYILNQKIDVKRKGNSSSPMQTIAASLKDFLSRLMDPSARTLGKLGTFCSATSMTISSIYDLFTTYNPVDNILVSRANLHLSYDTELLLSSMTRIVIDVANALNEKFTICSLAAIPPSYSYLIYRAGMHFLLTADISNGSMLQDFYELRRCCWYFSYRWLVAGTYLNTLETSAKTLDISLPHLGEVARPDSKLPGLC